MSPVQTQEKGHVWRRPERTFLVTICDCQENNRSKVEMCLLVTTAAEQRKFPPITAAAFI